MRTRWCVCLGFVLCSDLCVFKKTLCIFFCFTLGSSRLSRLFFLFQCLSAEWYSTSHLPWALHQPSTIKNKPYSSLECLLSPHELNLFMVGIYGRPVRHDLLSCREGDHES